VTLTATPPEAGTGPDDGAVVALVRRRLVVLVALGIVLGAVALVVVGERPGHRQPGTVVRNVPLALSCPTATSCTAVDDEGNAVRFDGTTWRRAALDAQAMTAVSCADPGFCVGSTLTGSVLYYRDGRWSGPVKVDRWAGSYLDAFGLSSITALSCPSRDFCMAADVLGHAFTFNGQGWSDAMAIEQDPDYHLDVRQGDEAVSGLSCPTPTFCAAVTAGGRALTWDGSSWSAPVTLTPKDIIGIQELVELPAVTGVSCADPGFCVAVASNGGASTWDGSAWSAQVPVDVASAEQGSRDGISSVSCPTPSFCMAADELGRVLTFDGTAWSAPRRIDPTLGLRSVSCPTPSVCVALDDLGDALVGRDGTWTSPRFVDP